MTIPTFANSPWGKPDRVVEYADGIYLIETPSHGGFAVRSDLLIQIPGEWRDYAKRWSHGFSWADYGWFEEDRCWAAVAIAFPALFSVEERRFARVIADLPLSA